VESLLSKWTGEDEQKRGREGIERIRESSVRETNLIDFMRISDIVSV